MAREWNVKIQLSDWSICGTWLGDGDIVERLEDFEDDVSVAERADKVRIKPMIQIVEKKPLLKGYKSTTQKVRVAR